MSWQRGAKCSFHPLEKTRSTLQSGKECACVVKSTCLPRPIGERAEFVSELCELRNSGEGLKNYSLKQHPPTTSGHFPRKGGRRGGAQLAHIHHPLKFSSLRGNIHSTRSNPEGISQLKTVGWVKPNNNNMDCRVASAPRNDAKLVGLPTNPNIYPRNDAKLVGLPTNPNIYPRNDAQPVVLPASPNIYPPLQ